MQSEPDVLETTMGVLAYGLKKCRPETERGKCSPSMQTCSPYRVKFTHSVPLNKGGDPSTQFGKLVLALKVMRVRSHHCPYDA